MPSNSLNHRILISRTRERVCFKGAVYHVTQRAPGKERIFLEDRDCLRFLKILKESSQKFNFEVYAFALMPNHIHILLSTNDVNLSEAMKNLFERYAIYFNRKYQRKGHVFYGRFRITLCSDDSYLLSCSVYIHLNPYRAGLCEKPEDYEWTSARLYMQVLKNSFINADRILSVLAKDKKEAQQRYLNILLQCLPLNINLNLDRRFVKDGIAQYNRVVQECNGRKFEDNELEKLIEKFKNDKYVSDLKDQKTRQYLVEQLLANDYSRKEIREKLGMSKSTLLRVTRNLVK